MMTIRRSSVREVCCVRESIYITAHTDSQSEGGCEGVNVRTHAHEFEHGL